MKKLHIKKNFIILVLITASAVNHVHAARSSDEADFHYNVFGSAEHEAIEEQLWRRHNKLLEQANQLSERMYRLSAEIEAVQKEIDALLDLHALRKYFDVQELFNEFDKHRPVKASESLRQFRSYRKTSRENLIKKYGDVFGRQFTAATTAYNVHGRTSSGRTTVGGTVAVDRSTVPLGTRMLSLHLGRIFRADDTGRMVVGNVIDIYMNDTTPNLLQWGRRNTEWILLDNAKIRAQREEAVEIVTKYTRDRSAALVLLTNGKKDVLNKILEVSFRVLTEDIKQTFSDVFKIPADQLAGKNA